jgi:hypothetical protein
MVIGRPCQRKDLANRTLRKARRIAFRIRVTALIVQVPLRSCSFHLLGGRLTSVLAGHSILPSEFPGSRPPESAKVMTARLRVATVSSLLLLIAIPTVGQSTSAPAARTEGDCPLAKSNPAGVPYSALVEITLLQTLADGTHIESKQQSTQVYHDSHGRLRQEFKQPFFGPTGVQEEFLRYIMITDPVDCVTYNLDVSAHVARRHIYAPAEMNPAGPTTEPSNVAKQPAPPTTSEELRPKTSTERLGTDMIEGLAVEGKRFTTTYPAGSQGNDRAIVVTSESWRMSLEPKLVVLSKTSDPRAGETTDRLTNFQLGEPSPDLFQVPSDYQIQDPPKWPKS